MLCFCEPFLCPSNGYAIPLMISREARQNPILTIANEYYVIYIGQCEGMLVYAKVTGLD